MEADLEPREPRSGYMGQSQCLLSFSTVGSLVSYPHLSLSLDPVVHVLAFSASPLTIRSPECQVLGVSTEKEKQSVRLFETYLCILATRLAHASGHPQSMAMLESPCAAPMEQLLLLIHTEFQCAL